MVERNKFIDEQASMNCHPCLLPLVQRAVPPLRTVPADLSVRQDLRQLGQTAPFGSLLHHVAQVMG